MREAHKHQKQETREPRMRNNRTTARERRGAPAPDLLKAQKKLYPVLSPKLVKSHHDNRANRPKNDDLNKQVNKTYNVV